MQPQEKSQDRRAPGPVASPSILEIAFTGTDSKLNTMGYPGLQNDTSTQKSSYAPALIVSPSNVLYLAWTDQQSHSGLHYVQYMTSTDGVNFSQPNQIAYGSSAAPSLTIFNGAVYIAWKDNDDRLNIMPINSTTPSQPDWTGADAPALGTLNNNILYVAWRDSSDILYSMTSNDGRNFTAASPVGGPTSQQKSPHAPVFAEFNGTLYIAWTGTQGKLNLMPIGNTKPKTIGETSETAPSLAVAGGQLYLAWTGQDSDHSLNLISTNDGVNFGTKQKVYQSTNAGLSIVGFVSD
ncbi:MAG TPA: hypothetical protein VKJ45_25830 [Blastocatellia bacterium]|nr:hypothetical protein [Blastocatellia bacterium]